jgi:cytochrome c-type protein NapB
MRIPIVAVLASLVAGVAIAQGVSSIRQVPPTESADPPLMREAEDTDLREARNYPEQPPLIPHAIEGYEVTANFNKCLTCHARAATGRSQAPMVSVTHFMDRENQVLAQVSPRRYFCTQCHVPQHPDAPLVENTFVDIDTLLRQAQE